MTRALVTGGAGFIGSNLVRALLERGDEVRVLDNFSTGSRANLDGLDIEIVEGELRSYERVHNAVRGVEVVFHLGALGSVPRSVQDPLTSSAVNVEGTLNVLLAARDEGVRRVVFSSSTSVYGSSRDAADAGGLSPLDPISPYGVAKLAAERYCIAFSRVYESFETVVLRYFNVFGPRQSPSSQYAAVVPLFITAIAAGEPVTIHGDGEQSRDFTYVDNVVDATIAAAEAEGASGRAFNVAGGAPASVNRVADTIGEILGRPVEKVFAPSRPGRHPRLVGRPDGRARGARLRAGGLARGRPAADGGGAARDERRLRDERPARADPHPAADRAAEHGRARAPRLVPGARPRVARLPHDARRRLRSRGARARCRSSPTSSASRWSTCSSSTARSRRSSTRSRCGRSCS